MIDLLSEFGNALFVLSAGLLAWKCNLWTREHGYDWEYRAFTDAIMYMSLALCFNSLWWFIARQLAPEGLYHLAWMRANSGYQTVGTGLLYLFGAMKFIKFVDRDSSNKMLTGAAVIVVVALGSLLL